MPLASRFRRWRIWSNHSGPTARPNSSKRIGAFGTVTYKKHKALLLVCPVFFLGGGKGIAEDGGRLNACLPICAEWPPGSEVSDIGLTTCPTNADHTAFPPIRLRTSGSPGGRWLRHHYVHRSRT